MIAIGGYGQCNCPDANSCAPCSGGVNQMTLRYLGNASSVYIFVFDDETLLSWGTYDPGDEISFAGSLGDGNFDGDRVRIYVGMDQNATLYTQCSDGISVGDSFGDFAVVGASSKNGGAICCNGQAEHAGPTFVGCPGPIDVTTGSGQCSRTVNWTPPSVVDNCDLVSLSSTHDPGTSFPVGSTVVIYSATDGDGNTTQCSFTVRVSENRDPDITGCPANITVEANASCQAVVSWMPPVASDNCAGVTMTSTHSPGSTFDVGTTTVTYTAMDVSGNIETCSFHVKVLDQHKELILTDCPDDIVVKAVKQPSVTWEGPTFNGECSGFELTSSHSSGDVFEPGQTEVTYTATNDEGVTLSCSFTVTVISLQLVVHEIVTPNGDQANEIWIIQNIDNFSDNSVVVYDRWGGVVYKAEDYDNEVVAWNGGTLPSGTYFYHVTARVDDTVVNENGFVELVR